VHPPWEQQNSTASLYQGELLPASTTTPDSQASIERPTLAMPAKFGPMNHLSDHLGPCKGASPAAFCMLFHHFCDEQPGYWNTYTLPPLTRVRLRYMEVSTPP
jgi:hypothetical protein